MNQETFEKEIMEQLTVSGLGTMYSTWKEQRVAIRSTNFLHTESPDFNLVQAMINNYSDYRDLIENVVPGTIQKIREYRQLQSELTTRLAIIQKKINQNIGMFKNYL